LRIGSAVCDGLFRIVNVFLPRAQEDVMANRVTQFVRRGVPILKSAAVIAPWAAFDRDDFEGRCGQVPEP